MKKILIKFAVVTAIFMASSTFVVAQGPPDPPGDPSIGGPPVGGSAPIGSGIGIMLMLAGGYGARKVYDIRKKLGDMEKLED
ncbi:MAG: hypothetical protein HOO86_04565 [Bacteroidales bacterium]|nr:hypothetical protein [Bacteroidales bacterium]